MRRTLQMIRFYFNDGVCFYKITFLGRYYVNITRYDYDVEKVTYCYDHKIIDNRISNIDSIPADLSHGAIVYINKILSMKAFL